MDVTNTTREEFLKTLKDNPQMIAFEGWDRGQPKLTTNGSRRTWLTAQAQPWYDQEVESVMRQAMQSLGSSPQQQQQIESPEQYGSPQLETDQALPKYSPVMQATPPGSGKSIADILRSLMGK